MVRRRKRASTRRNHGAASVEGKGGRLRFGAAAAVAGAAAAASGAATASEAAVLVSTISAAGLDHGQVRAKSFRISPGSPFVTMQEQSKAGTKVNTGSWILTDLFSQNGQYMCADGYVVPVGGANWADTQRQYICVSLQIKNAKYKHTIIGQALKYIRIKSRQTELSVGI